MARLSTYTKDVNLTGKDMLAGSNYVTTVNGIDQFETNNFTLKKVTEYINGQIVTDPSIISLKTNGGLVYETVSDTNYLAVDLSATNITGQLANSDLVNSSITINGTSVALGGSITIGEVSEVIAGTYLNGGGTEGTITLNHDNTTRTDTTSSISPAHESSFTVIDTLSTNATGHVTSVNTKTITLPVDNNTTYTIEAIDSSNDALIRLIGSDSSTDDIKLKAGANININVNESTDEIEIVGTAFGNVYTVNSEAAMIAATSTAGDLVVRTDVSKTFIHNGGTTGTVADFTELQFSGIQQIDLVEGEGIALEDHASNPITTLTQSNNDLKVINTLASSSERGGIQIGYTENGKNYPVELGPNPGDEKAYVNVPWTDTTYTNGPGLDLVGTEFSHTDTSSQASVNNSGRTYIQDITLDTFGHVTGLTSATETVTDTNNYVTAANVTGSTTKTLTLTRQGLSDLTAQWTDTDTDTIPNNGLLDINQGSGISLAITGGDFTADKASTTTIEISHADTSSQASINNSGRTYIQDITLDTYGHITGITSATETYQYTHPTHPGDDIDLDTGALSAGTVISDLDFNITTDTLGHVTDANASYQIYNLDNRYYTETEIGNFFSGATGITGYNKSNWDTAYSWGNHATQGYITDGNTNWDNIYGFITDGNTNWDNTYGFITASSTDTLTNKSGNISQWTNNSGYLTSLAGSTGGTLEVTGTGAWLTVEGNTGGTNPPLNQGLAFGWNRSNGQNETEILFRSSTSGHNGRLDIKSYNGGSDYSDTLAQFKGNGTINFPNPGNIVAEDNGGERILQRSYNSATWARLVSNSVGGELQLGRSNSAYVKLVTLGDSYLNGGNVGIGITNPGTKLDVNGVITATGGTSTNWNTAYGWGNHASAGYLTSFDITTQTDPKYLRSNADDTSSGSLTVVSYKFNGNASNPTNTTATIYDQSGVGLTASAHNFSIRNYNGSSMVESARFTTGSLTVIGDIVAYGSPSDISLKENIKPIKNALDKVEKLQGVTFDWKESDSILNIKEDIGFIAQDVQKVLPELVRENDNGKLSLRHQGIISVLAEAIKELSNRIKVLEDGSTK